MTTTLQLSEMVDDLRAEVGHSLLAAHGVNTLETQKYILKRTQRELYAAYDFPAMTMYQTFTPVAGSRYDSGPADIDIERINALWCREGSQWQPMEYGISPDHYSLYDPDNDVRGYPVLRWRVNPAANNLELWPIPSQNATILARGTKKLTALVNDSDPSTLDGTLIVMFAAAEILARQKDEDAALKLQKAQQYLNSILKQQGSHKRKPTKMTPTADGGRRPRAGIDYIPMGT